MTVLNYLRRIGSLRRTDASQAERIVAAAVFCGGLTLCLPAPARHADVQTAAANAFGPLARGAKEGFLTSQGRFVDRAQASAIAVKAKQIKEDHGLLTTQHLW